MSYQTMATADAPRLATTEELQNDILCGLSLRDFYEKAHDVCCTILESTTISRSHAECLREVLSRFSQTCLRDAPEELETARGCVKDTINSLHELIAGQLSEQSSCAFMASDDRFLHFLELYLSLPNTYDDYETALAKYVQSRTTDYRGFVSGVKDRLLEHENDDIMRDFIMRWYDGLKKY